MRKNQKNTNVLSLFVLIGLAGLLAGCGGSDDPFGFVEIEGKVTYEDGSMIEATNIFLHFKPLAKPVDPKTYPPIGFAKVNVADGTFTKVLSGAGYSGLVPGRHKVTVEVEGGGDSSIPARYGNSDTTPLEIDTADSPFELKIAKE